MHLLPPNASPQERDLSLATARAADLYPKERDPIRETFNIKTCPSNLLPWLAWALGIENWDTGWTDAVKRNTIAAAFDIHRKKGTIGALRRALEIHYDKIKVEESASDPYKFSVTIPSTEPLSNSQLDTITGIINANKNVRSHYGYFVVIEDTPIPLRIAVAVFLQQVETIEPDRAQDASIIIATSIAIRPHITHSVSVRIPS